MEKADTTMQEVYFLLVFLHAGVFQEKREGMTETNSLNIQITKEDDVADIGNVSADTEYLTIYGW